MWGLTNERDFPVPSDLHSCGVRHQSATMGSAISHQLTRFVEGEVHGSHCHDRNRSGQEHLCRSWCGCHRQARLGSPHCATQHDFQRLTRPRRLPAVLTQTKVSALLCAMEGRLGLSVQPAASMPASSMTGTSASPACYPTYTHQAQAPTQNTCNPSHWINHLTRSKKWPQAAF